MSTQSQGPAITSSPYRPYCLLRLGFLSCFGVESSDFTLWSGVCLRKDEILLWVFSGFLDTEGPAYSNVRSMCFPLVHPKCCEGHSVTGQGRREPSRGPYLFLCPCRRAQKAQLCSHPWDLGAPSPCLWSASPSGLHRSAETGACGEDAQTCQTLWGAFVQALHFLLKAPTPPSL